MSNVGKVSKDTMEYLGVEFQTRLIAQMIADHKFGNVIIEIINPNYFSDQYLRVIAAELKEAKDKDDIIPDVSSLEFRLMSKHDDEITRKYLLANVRKIRESNLNDALWVQEKALQFCKMKEMKRANDEIKKIIETGNLDDYPRCEAILRKALEHGDITKRGTDVFEDIEQVLSEDFRLPISTGIPGLDQHMNGGLARGELALILAAYGVGKAQPLYSKVLTPNGFTTMGELKVGDVVVSRDGEPCTVTGVFPQGKRDIYRVNFNDGTHVDCDLEHLWTVNNGGGLPVTTAHLKSGIEDGVIYEIPLVETVYFNTSSVPVDPYTMGAYLSTYGSQHEGNTSRLVCAEYVGEDVRIPERYLYNTVDDRASLLRGLMDFGGTVETGGYLVFKSEYDGLLDTFADLVRSLGAFAVRGSEDVTFMFKDKMSFVPFGTDIMNAQYYNMPVFDRARKTVEYIEYVSYGEVQCIMVDNPEHLYVTDGFTVTHNTTMVTKLANSAVNNGYRVLQIFFEDQKKVIQRKHVACWTGIELNEIPNNEELVLDRINIMQQQSRDMNGYLELMKFPSDSTSMRDIRQYVRRRKAEGQTFDLILIDYIDCVQPSKSYTDANLGEAAVMRELETMLEEYNMAGWTATQGNRSAINTPLLTGDKMGGSIKKGQIGHFVISIAKTMDQQEDDTATISILKSRFSKSGIIFEDVLFDNARIDISFENVRVTNQVQQSRDKQVKQNNVVSELLKRKNLVPDET